MLFSPLFIYYQLINLVRPHFPPFPPTSYKISFAIMFILILVYNWIVA
jgi:hypothetical protein